MAEQKPAPRKSRKPIPADLAQEVNEVAAEEAGLLPAPSPQLVRLERIEEKALEKARLAFENERLRDDLDRARSLHDKRIEFAGKLFGLARWWILGVLAMVVASGIASLNFKLSDGVLIAFITSTTVSVLGLFGIAAKWLYPASPEARKSKKARESEDP